MAETKVDEYYETRARETVNMLFDKRFLSDDLDRESIERLQEYLGFVFQSQVDSAVRMSELAAKFRESQRVRVEPPRGE